MILVRAIQASALWMGAAILISHNHGIAGWVFFLLGMVAY